MGIGFLGRLLEFFTSDGGYDDDDGYSYGFSGSFGYDDDDDDDYYN